ncbi:MAG: OstA family protein [Firmicutes bacterium]|nr:OstA family protein [Bacillota bacterium]
MKFRKIAFITMICIAMTSTLYAASDKPVDISGDVIEYDSTTGMMTATGSVKMLQDNAIVTGAKAEYNSKNKQGKVTGGVHFVKEDIDMTSESVTSLDENHIVAVGNVVMKKAESTLYGPQVDYYSDKQYAIINTDARIVNPDGTLTADKLESYMADNRIVGTGNAHIVSQTKNLDATGDVATYYGGEGQKGKIVLSGNAVAVQDGNTLRGKTLTLYMNDQSAAEKQVIVQPE